MTEFYADGLDIQIPVRLNSGEVRVFNVSEELAFSEETLSQDFMEQSAKYAWWAVVAEKARATTKAYEAKLAVAEAEADEKAREELPASGKKVTESQVASFIKKDAGYQSALAKVNAARSNQGIVERVVRAFEQRKDMLLVAGSHIRSERAMSGELRSVGNLADTAKTIVGNREV